MQKYVVHVSAFVRKDGKFLMARRAEDDDQAPGAWATPGGKVELGTCSFPIQQTLQEELDEEVGIKIRPESMQLIFNQIFTRSSGDQVLGLVFVADWQSGEAQALEDQAEIAWLSGAEVRELVKSTPYLSYLEPAMEKLT